MDDNEENLVEVELAKIVIRERGPEQYIYLKEVDGERSFPIVIGIFEAIAINRYVRNEEPGRPMTHDLLGNVIEGLNASLERIVVTDLKKDTFHASLYLRTDGAVVVIDSRPSDAVALAVRQKAKMFVSEGVFERVAGATSGGGAEQE